MIFVFFAFGFLSVVGMACFQCAPAASVLLLLASLAGLFFAVVRKRSRLSAMVWPFLLLCLCSCMMAGTRTTVYSSCTDGGSGLAQVTEALHDAEKIAEAGRSCAQSADDRILMIETMYEQDVEEQILSSGLAGDSADVLYRVTMALALAWGDSDR